MPAYVALLRGINVGGNKKVPMADLKKLMEKAGYENVKTLLASGNVVFEASEKNAAKLKTALEKLYEKKFGFTIPVLIRTVEELKALAKTKPFANITMTPETRLYITFLSGDKPKGTIQIPYSSPNNDYRILRASKTEVLSVLTVTATATVKVMDVLEKEFGKNVTTRNWNTVEKILDL